MKHVSLAPDLHNETSGYVIPCSSNGGREGEAGNPRFYYALSRHSIVQAIVFLAMYLAIFFLISTFLAESTQRNDSKAHFWYNPEPDGFVHFVLGNSPQGAINRYSGIPVKPAIYLWDLYEQHAK